MYLPHLSFLRPWPQRMLPVWELLHLIYPHLHLTLATCLKRRPLPCRRARGSRWWPYVVVDAAVESLQHVFRKRIIRMESLGKLYLHSCRWMLKMGLLIASSLDLQRLLGVKSWSWLGTPRTLVRVGNWFKRAGTCMGMRFLVDIIIFTIPKNKIASFLLASKDWNHITSIPYLIEEKQS